MWRFTFVAKCALPLLYLLSAGCAEDIPEPLTEEDLLDIIGPQPTSLPTNVGDTTPPRINDGKCDPTNGEDGVSPFGRRGLTIAFTEPVVEAEVISVDPRFPFATNLSWDGMVLFLTFLDGYEVSLETRYKILLSAKDEAGNEAKLQYSFTTMAVEQ